MLVTSVTFLSCAGFINTANKQLFKVFLKVWNMCIVVVSICTIVCAFL